MQLVKAGSCMSKPFWSQLSAIEVEFLSLYYAVRQCDFYFCGAPFVECMMDLSPAYSIFRKPLADLPKRLLRMIMELLDYCLKIVYIPSKKQSIADALPRHPTDGNIWPFIDPSTEWCSPHNKVGCNFAICYNTIDSDNPILNIFYAAAGIDEDYKNIIQVVASGCIRGEMRRKVGKHHPAYPLSYMWDTIRIVHDDKNHALGK